MKLVPKACFVLTVWTIFYFLFLRSSSINNDHKILRNFEAFNNETGVKSLIVPNIIHFIQFDQRSISFIHFICICSAFYNHGPTTLFLHTNVQLKGKYYLLLKKLLGTTLVVNQMEKPSHVFGQRLSSVQHSADVARIKILIKYGGIIMDTDVFTVRNLNRFRHFEAVIGWPEHQNMGSQVIIAHKDARFLGQYLGLYHNYRPHLWYYNAGEAPTKLILEQRPGLVTRVKTEFGVENLAEQLYSGRWQGWAERYTIHLLNSHKQYLTNTSTIEENNYEECGCAVSDMIQSIVEFLQFDGIHLGDGGHKSEEHVLRFIESDSKSLLHKYLTRDLFNKLKHLRTESYHSSLEDVIRSGLAHPDSHLGLYAPDAESFTVFRSLFDPVIRDYHGLKGRISHPASNWNTDTSHQVGNFDGDFVRSTRIRIARNLENFPLNSKMTKEDYLRLERSVVRVLESLTGELSGSYHSLSEMSPTDHEKLVSDHLMFDTCDQYLTDGGACQHWPAGRGIFINTGRTFLVWVGEEDHLRIIGIEEGGDLGRVFSRLGRALEMLETGLEFAHSSTLGYLTYCPSNLGTTMRASVHIALPRLTRDHRLRSEAESRGLQVRGAGGEHRDHADTGVVDLSNVRRLGATELEIVSGVYQSVQEIIALEQSL